MSFKKNVGAMRDAVLEMQHHFVRIEVYLEQFKSIFDEIKKFNIRFDITDQNESSHLEQRYREVGKHLNEQQIFEWKQKEKVRITQEYNVKRNLIVTAVLKNIPEDEETIRKILLRLRYINEERELLLQQAIIIGKEIGSNSLIEIQEIAAKSIIQDLILIKNDFNNILSLFNQVRKQLMVIKEKYTIGESTKINRPYVQASIKKIEEICGELRVVFSEDNEDKKVFISGMFEKLSFMKDRNQSYNKLVKLESGLNLLESDLKDKKLW